MQLQERRSLGSSDLAISTVTMGCWAIVGDGTWGPQDESDAIAAIHAALAHGVNSFDSAEGYGAGYSEQILAKALKGRRQEAILASKVSPDHVNSYDDLLRSCEQSLQNLGTDYIDLYYLHWPNRSTPMDEILRGFAKLRQDGKIRCFGVSNFGCGDLSELLAHDRCEVNQLPYNLLWRAIENKIMPLCQEHDVGVTCYSPLAQGLLTGKFASLAEVPAGRARTRHFSSQRPGTRHGEAGQEAATTAALAAIAEIAAELSCPMGELALAWLIQQAGVTSVIAGARNARQSEENARAMQRQLPTEAIARLNQATQPLKEAFGDNPDMWQSDSRYR
jgi:myo-inositol catabolism protein IolS